MCSKLVRHHCAYVVGQKRKHIDFENSMQHIGGSKNNTRTSVRRFLMCPLSSWETFTNHITAPTATFSIHPSINTMKLAIFATLAGSAVAFSPAMKSGLSTALFNGPEIGAGGMADTRNPDALEHEDARKSISAAPSFEEYLKMRDSGAAAAPAPAPAAPAPAAPAPAACTPPPPAAPAAPAASSGPEM